MVSKRRLTGEERREQILNAALDVFAEKGFNGARSREIARRAAISETLVFRHFANKEQLYRDALDHLCGGHPVADDIQEAMARSDDWAVFAGLARHMLEHSRQDSRILRLHLFEVLDRMRYSGREDVGLAGDKKLEVLLSDYLGRRAGEGALAAENPDLSAKLFLYWVFMAIADRDLGLTASPLDQDDAELADALTRRFLKSLAC